ncbi:MAG: replicative DNA helicase [Candidatus Omnitrophica bacterium CG1_02_49_10]|nr:MAG: replicative DNA helicase [Candidatus Omnitrophica bacterium CG1_02_49_10]
MADIKPRDITLEKMPPQALEAEVAIMGSMLIENSAISDVIEIIDESYFYKSAHKKIFRAMVRLYADNKAVDLITVSDELKKKGELEDIGGSAYIIHLAGAVPTAVNVRYHAKIVKEKGVLRNLINTATQIAAEGYDSEEDVDKLLDKAEQAIFDITSRKIESNFVPVRDIIKNSIETIDNLYQRKANITGIPTGFHELDAMTAGLQNSDLIIVAGRPSMGKSALATSIAEHASLVAKVPVALFSLEMSKEQLVQRMLCSHARVNAHNVRTGFLSQTDWPRLTNAAGKLSDAPLYIDDSPSISALELRAKARRLKAQYDIKLIIVDYLQLMRGLSKSENRQQEISDITRSLKALARELNIPLIAISQLSRAVESRQDHRPQLSDLRESGAIEQDADLVGLLLREEYYNPREDNKGISELIIAKQRNGPVGSISLAFIKEYARFENLSSRDKEVVE